MTMLSLLKRKPKHVIKAEAESDPAEPARRSRQQNIKVSEDCSAYFAALAKAQGMSKAALFEDMVAERLDALKKRGVKIGNLAE
jgi:hypothetical protein